MKATQLDGLLRGMIINFLIMETRRDIKHSGKQHVATPDKVEVPALLPAPGTAERDLMESAISLASDTLGIAERIATALETIAANTMPQSQSGGAVIPKEKDPFTGMPA